MLKPLAPLDVPPGTLLQLQFDPRATSPADSASPALTTPAPESQARAWLARPRQLWATLATSGGRLQVGLLVVGVLVYGLTRLVALEQFPIYFFADEAVQTLNAEELLNNGLRDFTGTFLPPYFLNVNKWSLGLTVYVQMVGVALFGTSMVVTRAVSALVGGLTVVAITLILRLVFRIQLWWAGALVLAALPVWFLHSRTAFETVMMVAFYACFLCCYLLYRYRDPRFILGALAFGAATFYSYSNGQGVVALTALLLLLSDWPYHLSQRRNRRLLLQAALLVGLLVLPYLRFRWLHPEAVEQHLRTLDSYWLEPLPVGEKLARFLSTYGWGLSPGYWFFPNDTDLVRHLMKGKGHLRLEFLPLAAVGLWVCLREWRSSAHRLVLITFLAAPFAAALVGIAATRALAMVVPATLLITLGLDQIAAWTRRWVSSAAFAVGTCLLLSLLSLAMLRGALVEGPTWFSDYGLGGMQYGAPQLFGDITEELDQNPERSFMVSPTWANGTDLLARFFLSPAHHQHVRLSGIETYLLRKTTIPPEMVFVLPPAEYERARGDPKLALQPPERVLAFPDGLPGFYFVRIAYSAAADGLFASEQAERQQPVSATITLEGQQVEARYSRLDIGQLADIFDQDPASLMRGMEANPFLLELTFPAERELRELGLTVATMDFRLAVTTTSATGEHETIISEHRNTGPDPRVVVALPDGPRPIRALRLEITSLNVPPGDPTHIHIRELELR